MIPLEGSIREDPKGRRVSRRARLRILLAGRLAQQKSSVNPDTTAGPPRGLSRSQIRKDRVKVVAEVQVRECDTYELGELSRRNNSTVDRAPDARPFLDIFCSLPPEIRILILDHLPYSDVERLRRTCKALHAIIDARTIRSLMPGADAAVTMTCRHCLGSDYYGHYIIRAGAATARKGLVSRCFLCMARMGDFQAGKKYCLVNGLNVWICRWCGFPVTPFFATRSAEQYHRYCYEVWDMLRFLSFLCGIAQWIVTLVGAGLCWAFFRHDLAVILYTTVRQNIPSLLALPC